MRKLKIIEHISLDGVVQTTSGPEDDFPYGDWTAPYRSPARLEIVTRCTERHATCCLAAELTTCWPLFGRKRRKVRWRTG